MKGKATFYLKSNDRKRRKSNQKVWLTRKEHPAKNVSSPITKISVFTLINFA